MIDITDKKFKLPFFWTLAVLFFMTASFLILYAFGYTFNRERGIFVYAGSITIKSNPRLIDVEMNGLNVSKKLNRINSSFHVGRIHPDEYIVKISAPGFNTWSKKVSVRSGFSTEFWNVLLTKTNYERKEYDSKNVSDFFISPSENILAGIKTEDGKFKIFTLNTEDSSYKEIFASDEYSFTDNKEENIEWSPRSQRLIFPLKKGLEKEYFYHDLEIGQTFSISEISGFADISNVRWDSNDKDFIFFMSEKNLYRINILNPQNVQNIAENISSYDISGDQVYYFKLPEGLVFHVKSDMSSAPKQITKISPTEMSDSSYKIIAYDEDKMVMRNNSGTLYVLNKGEDQAHFRKLSDAARGSQFSNDGKKLLYWDEREIYTYYMTEWETQPYRSENEIKSVTRYSQQLENVHWNNDYEHVIFLIGNQLKITELDDRGSRNTFDIANFSINNSKAVSNFSENKIYFIDNSKNEGVPVIQSIDFPEKTGILNF